VTAGVCCVYEQPAIREVTGDAIRPGGLDLTESTLDRCDLPANARILDVGCGAGATVEHLRGARQCRAVGIDPSSVLLGAAHRRNANLPLAGAVGERLPFPANAFDALLAECCLSLISDPDRALAEWQRVLAPGGTLIVSDIYARQPAGMPAARQLPIACCLSQAMTQAVVLARVRDAGLTPVLWEDHTRVLRQLTGEIIMAHGSLECFWARMAPDSTASAAIQTALSATRPGYFVLIAVKDAPTESGGGV
jgi:ubiquinone/menaquinone biosynthesis C-methylase UbiE